MKCLTCFFARNCNCTGLKGKYRECFRPAIVGEKTFKTNIDSEQPCYISKCASIDEIDNYILNLKSND